MFLMLVSSILASLLIDNLQHVLHLDINVEYDRSSLSDQSLCEILDLEIHESQIVTANGSPALLLGDLEMRVINRQLNSGWHSHGVSGRVLHIENHPAEVFLFSRDLRFDPHLKMAGHSLCHFFQYSYIYITYDQDHVCHLRRLQLLGIRGA